MMKNNYLCGFFFLVVILGVVAGLKKDFYIEDVGSINLPSPPMYGSELFKIDEQEYSLGRSMQGSSRWQMAIDDASYRQFDKHMSEELGIQITKNKTPSIYRLLRIIQKSSLRVVDKYKAVYKRPRPYVYYDSADCVANKNGENASWSYPSGHASFSWAAALALSELNPDDEKGIMKKATEYGQSRVICGSHWQSDVDAGQKVGSTLYAALKEHPEFVDVMVDAEVELRSAKENSEVRTKHSDNLTGYIKRLFFRAQNYFE